MMVLVAEKLTSCMASSTPTHLKFADITDQIIGAFFAVYNTLGPGLAERVYQRALIQELRGRGLDISPQRGSSIRYGQAILARFRPDLLVDGKVVVEIKARSRILRSHWAQLLHYLAASGVEVGLLLNFGPRPRFRRLVLSRATARGADTTRPTRRQRMVDP